MQKTLFTALILMFICFLYDCLLVGWEPKNFVSSRSQRFDTGTQQKPEDFMDEEVFLDMSC